MVYLYNGPRAKGGSGRSEMGTIFLHCRSPLVADAVEKGGSSTARRKIRIGLEVLVNHCCALGRSNVAMRSTGTALALSANLHNFASFFAKSHNR